MTNFKFWLYWLGSSPKPGVVLAVLLKPESKEAELDQVKVKSVAFRDLKHIN